MRFPTASWGPYTEVGKCARCSVAPSDEHVAALARTLEFPREFFYAGQLHAVFNVKVDPLDLILDVPAARSPGNTVYVLSLQSPRRGIVGQLADRSTMWKEFGSTFHDYTREIRLFCPASIRQRLRDQDGERSNHLKLYDILREAALRVVRATVQLEFFGPPPRPRP